MYIVLSFLEVDNDNQKLLKEEDSKLRRGSVGVCYGRPVTLLNAAMLNRYDTKLLMTLSNMIS